MGKKTLVVLMTDDGLNSDVLIAGRLTDAQVAAKVAELVAANYPDAHGYQIVMTRNIGTYRIVYVVVDIGEPGLGA